jgi:hypothetical protein
MKVMSDIALAIVVFHGISAIVLIGNAAVAVVRQRLTQPAIA